MGHSRSPLPCVAAYSVIRGSLLGVPYVHSDYINGSCYCALGKPLRLAAKRRGGLENTQMSSALLLSVMTLNYTYAALSKSAVCRGRTMTNSRKSKLQNKRNRGAERVPRPISSGCVVRRAYTYGNLSYPGTVDAGIQVGITPAAVLDWSAYVSVWQRFRVLSATVHFIVWGQQDATTTFSTLYAFHDRTSTGAPATILDALVRNGRKVLPFNNGKTHQQFTFQPLPWTSAGVSMTMANPRSIWQPTAGFAPLTSCAVWVQNYNSISQAPGINVQVEMVLAFDSPQ